MLLSEAVHDLPLLEDFLVLAQTWQHPPLKLGMYLGDGEVKERVDVRMSLLPQPEPPILQEPEVVGLEEHHHSYYSPHYSQFLEVEVAVDSECYLVP